MPQSFTDLLKQVEKAVEKDEEFCITAVIQLNEEEENEEEKKAMERHQKAEITRLKNLLRNHRDHIITKQYDTLKQSPYNMEIMEVIELVDNAIKLLIGGL